MNSNYYDPATDTVWHVPSFCGLNHRCPGDAGGTEDAQYLAEFVFAASDITNDGAEDEDSS